MLRMNWFLQLTLLQISEDDEGEAIDSVATTKDLPSLLVQRVLTSKAEHEDEEKIQCKNLFHMFLQVKDCRVLTIIDSGSCSNLASSDLVKKFGFPLVLFLNPTTSNDSITVVILG